MKHRRKRSVRAAGVLLIALTICVNMILIRSAAYAVDAGVLKMQDKTITLDGTGPTMVTVPLLGSANQDIYGFEGSWDVAEQGDSEYIRLKAIESDAVDFSGLSSADPLSGKTMWMDDTLSAPVALRSGTELFYAIYELAADTPPGDYTVGFYCSMLIGSDYEAYEIGRYYSAVITVEESGGTPHVHSLVKREARPATCAESGNNAYWLCSGCGRSYKDSAGTTETTVAAETISKLTTHMWGDWTEIGEEQIRECTVCFTSERRDAAEAEPEIVPGNAEQPDRPSFGDVAADAYYYAPVEWAVANGITSGTSETTFSPNADCTRAQAVMFLWRAAGMPAVGSCEMPFTDVAADTYYHDALLWAVENGITSGTSDTTFSPDAQCTRAQIVTFLWRSQGTPAASAENIFADVYENDYFCAPVLWAVGQSITSGTSDTTFSPNADCTRAQIVTFLYRNYVK